MPRSQPVPSRRSNTLKVGCLGVGTLSLGGRYYGSVSEASASASLHRAVDLGITLIDMADVYGSEPVVASVLGDRRDEVVLSTKGGLTTGTTPASFDFAPDGRPEHLHRAIDRSLAILGVDHLDLYYLHRVDPDVSVEESVGALADAVDAGKIRSIGLSEASVATLERAQQVHPVGAVQVELSLWSRDGLDGYRRWCEDHHALLVAYCPLGRGFLTGRLSSDVPEDPTDIRSTHPRFTAEARRANHALIAVVEEVARKHQATPAQVALAWLLALSPTVVPIPGMDRVEFVEQNADAVDVVLDAEDLAVLDGLPQPVQERYPDDRRAGWTS